MTDQAAEEFRLPDVGEGLTEAEIVAWHVSVGDTVEINQIIVDIETAKSVVELPSPFAGEVVALLAAQGETVDVGTPIIAVRTADSRTAVTESTSSEAPAPAPAPDSENGSFPATPESMPRAAADEREPRLLVGYGAREESGGRRRARRASHSGDPSMAGVPGRPTEPGPRSQGRKPRAKPPVRKLAKTLGVELDTLVPSRPDGIVSREEVERAVEAANPHDAPAASCTAVAPTETRIPIRGVLKHMANAMVTSAFTAPHVTEFITVDLTKTLELRETVLDRRESRGVRVTPLAFVARAYVRALKQVPLANGRWDEEAQEIVVPATVNLGIAAATPRGLIVPNIKDADRLGLLELATAINDLAERARAGKTPPDAMNGGTTTITNVGVFGVDTGTPILNPGETAILAVGTVRRQPWVVNRNGRERIEPRSIMQLALSFDHRVLDGQQGSQLLAQVAELLTEPGLAAL